MLDMPPPKQKPVAAIFPFECGRAFSHCAAATKSWVNLAAIELGEQLAALVVVARIAADRRQRVRREAMKFSSAKRRATSSVCGFSPRFSWMTMNAGQFRRRCRCVYRR